MKKGVTLPLNFIIVIALGIIVLLVVIYFLVGSEAGATPSLTLSQALIACNNACLTDEIEKEVENIHGVCYGDLDFIKLEFIIQGEKKKCLDITPCKIRTDTGDCMITENSAESPPNSGLPNHDQPS